MRLPVPAGVSIAEAGRRLDGERLWPPRLLSDGTVTATSVRTTFTATANVVAHTVGVWTEVVAALSADVGWVHVVVRTDTFATGVATPMLLNVGVGAAASEVIVIPSLGVGWLNSAVAEAHPGWLFPIFIPKGSRVAIQNQSAVTLAAVGARIYFFGLDGAALPSQKIVALGASLATSRGVTIATPGGANTEGAWTEIIATTAEPYTALGMSIQGAADTTQASGSGLVDVAVGSAGNEIPIISEVGIVTNAAESIRFVSPLVHPCRVPAGSRLSVRWQVADVAASIDVILYGVRPAT